MANVLTVLAPTLYSAAQVVSREQTGFIPAVDVRIDEASVAQGDTVSYPIIPKGTASSYSPGMTTATGSDTTPTTVDLTFSNHSQYTWHLNSEQEISLANGGQNLMEFMRQSTEQGLRVLCNQIESHVATVAYQGASRATGTAGTTPFGSNLGAAVDVRKILRDNGAPDSDVSLVLGTAAEAAALKIFDPTNSVSGPDITLREQGIISRQYGLNWRCSQQVVDHTKGTGTGYLLNDASSAIGDTVIAADTGSGTIIAGDIVTFAGTTDKYVVNSAFSGGSFTIGRPGLLAAETNNDAITIGNNYAANVALHRNSVVLAMRPPSQVQNANIQTMPITDPRTGMTFLMERIAGDGQTTYRLRVLYAAAAVQSEHIAILLG